VWRRDGLVEHANLATWLSSNELAAATVLEAVSPTDRAWIASMLRGPEVFAKQSLISGIGRYRPGEERVEAVGPLEGFVVVEPVDDHEAGAAFVAILAVCDPAQRQTVRCAAARALRWPARSVLPSAAAPPGQTRSSARRAATDPNLNHYRAGVRSFPGARQWFDLMSTALIRLGIFDARRGRGLNHYRDGDRSFLGARQCFDLISTALVRSGHLRCPSRARYRPSRLSASLTTMPFGEQRHCPSEISFERNGESVADDRRSSGSMQYDCAFDFFEQLRFAGLMRVDEVSVFGG
jgi:hypothetical protein